jgi:amino acid permease
MLQLCAAISINLFPSRVYGEAEFWFSTVKILTIVFLSRLSHSPLCANTDFH